MEPSEDSELDADLLEELEQAHLVITQLQARVAELEVKAKQRRILDRAMLNGAGDMLTTALDMAHFYYNASMDFGGDADERTQNIKRLYDIAVARAWLHSLNTQEEAT